MTEEPKTYADKLLLGLQRIEEGQRILGRGPASFWVEQVKAEQAEKLPAMLDDEEIVQVAAWGEWPAESRATIRPSAACGCQSYGPTLLLCREAWRVLGHDMNDADRAFMVHVIAAVRSLSSQRTQPPSAPSDEELVQELVQEQALAEQAARGEQP